MSISQQYNSKLLQKWSYFLGILILLVIFAIYSHSIFSDKLFLGEGDKGGRFSIAMQFVHEPSKALDLKYWVSAWPPVPFIIQSFIVRLVLFLGVSDISISIHAVELTSVAFVLLGFFFIGRSVAVQTNEMTGLLAFLMSFCTPSILNLAHTPMAEAYAFFFIIFGIYNVFYYVKSNKSFIWIIISILSFTLAYFCRTESLFFAIIAGVFLLAHKRWKSGLLLIITTILVAVTQILGAKFLIEGTHLYDRELWGGKGFDRVIYAKTLFVYFLNASKKVIVFSLIWILPLTYLKLKQRQSVKGNEFSKKKENLKTYIINLYNTFCFWLVNYPIAIWSIFFLVGLTLPILLALQGAIDPLSRYLYLANIFITTAIALMIAQTVETFSVINKRLAKYLVIANLTLVIIFSSTFSLAYASGSVKNQKMPLEIKEVITFISQNKLPKSRVVFDFLEWQEYGMAAYLLDPQLEKTPTQFSLVWTAFPREVDSEITSLLPKKFQVPAPQSIVEGRTAIFHAYIYAKKPSYFVIANESLYKKIENYPRIKRAVGFGRNYIQKYLTAKDQTKSTFEFQSPYILPENKITLNKVYENESYIILKP
ncbi:MAG: hypothetical protein RMX96_31715 [Nostoc sp. ChiSLP02]|nr:hypothetical protein [Nostoc sp. DedSLP05]MDZ8103375.1 hypothetical protein [Nostoc sp. DedSLP01]MDZ8189392.1 hypothetical protein [Nostoc sp. ChiSLP02]